MKKLLFFVFLLLSLKCYNLGAAILQAAEKGAGKQTHENDAQVSATEDQEEEEEIPIKATGFFHFFWSDTLQTDEYDVSHSKIRTENEGIIDLLYKNEISDKERYLVDFNLKKNFNNSLTFRTFFELEDDEVAKLQLSSYRKIQDDMLVNTYWIRKGDDAFDRNINLTLKNKQDVVTNTFRNDYILNDVLTEYDTALLHAANTDSASISVYKSFLDKNLTIGASYTPRVYNNEIKNPFTNYKDVITVGAMYQTDVNENLNLKFSTLGEYGTPLSQPNDIKEGLELANLNALNFGTVVKYNNFSVAGSLGLWYQSNHLKNIMAVTTTGSPSSSTTKDSYYFDVAASYDINEKAGVSLSYFKSLMSQNYSKDGIFNTPDKSSIIEAGQSEFENISLAFDYKLLSGLVTPYAEINKFRITDNNGLAETRKDNIGWVLVFGAKNKF
jgi:hypothetical protein